MKVLAGNLILAVLGPLVMLGAVELVLWGAGVEPIADDPVYERFARQRFCKFGWGTAQELCAPELLETEPPRDLVVALGGSSVAGYRIEQPFPQALQKQLQRQRPERYRVFNRGLFCKDSIYVRDCGLAALDANPDWLVVYTGHNDNGAWGARNPGLWIWLEEHSWIYDLDTVLAKTRFYSVVARSTLPKGGPATRMFEVPDPATTAEPRKVSLAKLEDNLSILVAAARERGTRVILVTVVSNLWEYPLRRKNWGRAAAWGKGSTSRGLEEWRRHFLAGIAADKGGDYATALTAFKRARDVFQRGRAHSEANQRLREFAARNPDVVLIDFERELEVLAAPKGIGCNYFGEESYCDQFHPNTHTHAMIARRLATEIVMREGSPTDRAARRPEAQPR